MLCGLLLTGSKQCSDPSEKIGSFFCKHSALVGSLCLRHTQHLPFRFRRLDHKIETVQLAVDVGPLCGELFVCILDGLGRRIALFLGIACLQGHSLLGLLGGDVKSL